LPRLEEEREPVTTADFERLLSVLRQERTALEAEWHEMSKRGKLGKSTINDKALKDEAEDTIRKIQRGFLLGPKKTPPDEHIPPPTDGSKEPAKKAIEENVIANHDEKKTALIGDPLQFGQTLFRAGMYPEALAALEKVEIVGMKPEERAPIIYFKACCQGQLGQSAKAIALFEDVIKVRGDEQLVEYARWQLEHLHWHRNVENALEDVRKRLKVAEKAK
jgi:tetratricopeptide (TPR) repeat protein